MGFNYQKYWKREARKNTEQLEQTFTQRVKQEELELEEGNWKESLEIVYETNY